MNKSCLLSTSDNPFNPFVDWDNWFAYDEEKNYHCCEYLDRVAKNSNALSKKDQQIEQERAIDSIISLNLLKMQTNGEIEYIKVESKSD